MPDSDAQEQTSALHDLGPGVGSKVERIKVESDYLRGQIAEELAQDTSRFSEAQIQLIKFHGMYQQENRDVRQERKASRYGKSLPVHDTFAHPWWNADRRTISRAR